MSVCSSYSASIVSGPTAWGHRDPPNEQVCSSTVRALDAVLGTLVARDPASLFQIVDAADAFSKLCLFKVENHQKQLRSRVVKQIGSTSWVSSSPYRRVCNILTAGKSVFFSFSPGISTWVCVEQSSGAPPSEMEEAGSHFSRVVVLCFSLLWRQLLPPPKLRKYHHALSAYLPL